MASKRKQDQKIVLHAKEPKVKDGSEPSSSSSSASSLADEQPLLTEYETSEILQISRTDCLPGKLSALLVQQLRGYPNKHPKHPDCKQRTPNVAVDNIVLWKKDDTVFTVLGLCDKHVKINDQMQHFHGWCMSGGHVEYGSDVSLLMAARRELREEFGVEHKDIIRSCPVAVCDDFFRDMRGIYVTHVFCHWINAEPKPSDEHKVIVTLPVSKLQHILRTTHQIRYQNKGDKPVDLGFVHGHDSLLAAVLNKATAFKTLFSDISASQ